MKNICFVAPLTYPLFKPILDAPFGGSEVRVANIARELAIRNNFVVSIVVGDYGQPHEELIDNVHLISWKGRDFWGTQLENKKVPVWLSFLHKSILYRGIQKFRRILKRIKAIVFPNAVFGNIGTYQIYKETIAVFDEIDADIYIVPGNSYLSAELAYYCSRKGKQYIFLSGSDLDYYLEYKSNPNGRDIYGTSHALKCYSIAQADAHFVQNEHQQTMLREGYDRSSILIKNPIDLKQIFPRSATTKTILWVGKSDERVKRPSLVLDLARQLPEYEFIIIMNMNILNEHGARVQEAEQLSNVTLVEKVPFELIERYFAEAHIHINTSVFEGFPNTFLQAAKYGVPTISMNVDPGGMLSKHACGLVSGEDILLLKKSLRRLMGNEKLYGKLSSNCLRYIQEHHEKSLIAQQYEQTFNRVIKEGRIE